MLTPGKKFPDFQLHNQDGKARSLKNYEGSWLVLYVYPKDDTPGCTIQGKSFTEQKAAFDKLAQPCRGFRIELGIVSGHVVPLKIKDRQPKPPARSRRPRMSEPDSALVGFE